MFNKDVVNGGDQDSINLSEYLDKAYDRFDPNYKIRFEDDGDDDA